MEKCDWSGNFDIVATCASGLERTLKSELKRLSLPESPAINGGISFSGTAKDVARCNINLRTADRVYVKLGEFEATSFDNVYDGVKSLRLERFLPKDAAITVNGRCVKSDLFAVSATQGVVKKAIADRLCSVYGLNRLPESGAEHHVEFRLYKNVFTLLLDTSGKGLHKRGYRELVGIAPIKETLASGLLLMSDFYYKDPFCDPFAGSGTIVIEAARIALGIAPGISRRFAFNEWKEFDKSAFTGAFEEAKDGEKRNKNIVLYGYDIDKKAVDIANRHAERAGVKDNVKFRVRPVSEFYESEPRGTIVTNPPYGERVYDRKAARECYNELGKAFKKLDDWSLFLITSDKGFEKAFGRRADRIKKLYNSEKECEFYYYYKTKKPTFHDGEKGENND